MSEKKWPKRLRDTEGLRVRLLREIQNGYASAPAGRLATVQCSSRWNKLEIAIDPCEHCGMKMFVRGDLKHDLEPID